MTICIGVSPLFGLEVITCNEGQIAANYKGYQFVYPDDFVMNPYGFTDWLG